MDGEAAGTAPGRRREEKLGAGSGFPSIHEGFAPSWKMRFSTHPRRPPRVTRGEVGALPGAPGDGCTRAAARYLALRSHMLGTASNS